MAGVSFYGASRNVGIAVEGIEALKSFDDLPAELIIAARQAINKTADRARTAASRAIRLQVNFPNGYLDPGQRRLTVAKYASGLDLEATVWARQQPTSLARFAVGNPKPLAKGGVSVSVKPGKVSLMANAFIFPLRNGNSGLAVRTKDGRRPRNAWFPKPLGGGLWLLYGPSVDQVFKSVRGDIAPDAAEFLENEFTRLMELRA